MPKPKQLKRTKVDLTDLLAGQEEDLAKIEFALIEAQGLTRDAIRVRREASIAELNAQVADARAQAAYIKLVLLASEHSNTVAEEPVWMKPYRSSEGHIMLETIFTQREQRLAARVAHKQLQNMVNNDEFKDLFEEEEESSDGND